MGSKGEVERRGGFFNHTHDLGKRKKKKKVGDGGNTGTCTLVPLTRVDRSEEG